MPFFARSVRCGLTFAVSIARGLEMPAALVARAGAVHESLVGTFETCRPAPTMSVYWGHSEVAFRGRRDRF
jgi:hypothetical protein